MAGLFDNIGGLLGPDPNADARLAETYGITPEQLSAMRMSSLGQIGSILLAAAQPGPVGQRGEVLAKLAGVSNDAQKAMLTAAQARLLGQRAKDEQEERARRAQALKILQNIGGDDIARARMLLDPSAALAARDNASIQLQNALAQQRALAPGEIETYRRKKDIDAEAQSKVPSAAERQAALGREALKSLGFPDDQATALANGLVAGTHTFADVEVADPNVIGGKRKQRVLVGPNGPITPGGGPAPGGSGPAGAPLTPDQQKILDRSTYPSGVAISDITGGMGAVRRSAQWLGNTLGAPFGADVAPDLTRAEAFMKDLDTLTKNTLAQEVPGRVTNMIREELATKHSVPIADIGTPDATALGKLKGRRDFVQQQLNDVNRRLSQPATLDQKGYRDLLENKAMLERVVDMHDFAIRNFWKPETTTPGSRGGGGSTGGSGTTRSGVPWRVVQ
ncbi:hypothetical protein [Enterovirga aerilata]|uniref:Uncharacterized protein n=1 Tax=Enterovirga aerilata TaxID=2730920 RepID=A0A849IF48_9HYPH|nr:hypothetical protein [Enterovirga sp. DB1703]NNM74740.1 hypothetical protein [Enterovirga sp. DB1703]